MIYDLYSDPCEKCFHGSVPQKKFRAENRVMGSPVDASKPVIEAGFALLSTVCS
jgi:hypothetical protein